MLDLPWESEWSLSQKTRENAPGSEDPDSGTYEQYHVHLLSHSNSDGMSTRIAGGLLEDVELDSVDDLGSLTSQLEMALKEKEGVTDSELTMTEEEKERIAQEADDGW